MSALGQITVQAGHLAFDHVAADQEQRPGAASRPARGSIAQETVREQRPNVSRIALADDRIGHIDRPARRVHTRITVGHVGRLGQRVGHLVRSQGPGQMVRKEPLSRSLPGTVADDRP